MAYIVDFCKFKSIYTTDGNESIHPVDTDSIARMFIRFRSQKAQFLLLSHIIEHIFIYDLLNGWQI